MDEFQTATLALQQANLRIQMWGMWVSVAQTGLIAWGLWLMSRAGRRRDRELDELLRRTAPKD